VNLYLESSAVLAWLLGEVSAESVLGSLADSSNLITSQLTLIECERVLIRGSAQGRLSEGEALDLRRAVSRESARWHVLVIADEILERCRQPFPSEPVRTLDAIHLASALAARKALPDVAVLSLDARLRDNAGRLGFRVVP
jgi:predicted nucleic acid-binding protein